MSKIVWKPGTMIYPLPAVMISCGDISDTYNIITVSWTGTICTDPAMTYISVRPERYSYNIIKDSMEFVINLSTSSLVKAADFCGVKSGRDVNKFKSTGLTPEKANIVKCPLIRESPVNIECKVQDIIKLGSHDMFISKVVAVNVDDNYIDSKGKFHLHKTDPICYSHGEYYSLGKPLGHFGFSIAKRNVKR